MIPHNRKCFAVIVHFGEVYPTNKLVQDLIKSPSAPDLILVVDNGPQANKLHYQSPKALVVRTSHNTGYAGGIEVGLGILHARQADKNDLVVAFNNDVKLDSGDIQRIRTWWSRQDRPVLAGTKFGSVNLLTGRTQIIRQNGGPAVGWRASYKLPYIHGSILSAAYGTLSTIRLADEYFMYWEDVYMGSSARSKGIALDVIQGLKSTHDDKVSDKLTDEHLYYLVRNGVLFLESQPNTLWRIYWLMKNRLRLAYHTAARGNPKRHIIIRALKDGMQKKTGQVHL